MNANALTIRLTAAKQALGAALTGRQTCHPGEARERLAARIAREPELRPMIDRACRHYIAREVWLLPEPELIWFCQDRLAEGTQLAIECLQTQFPTRITDECAALHYLLIESWPEHGLPRWRARMDWL